jgi:hypothetical protein
MVVLSESIKHHRKVFHVVGGLNQGRKDSDDDSAASVLKL